MVNLDSSDPYFNLIYKRLYISGIYQNYFISKLQPYKIFELAGIEDKRIIDLKKGIDIDSNPIIILTRFKSN